MAPLRSSRTTRNAEHNTPRNRAGALDYDPADGLPVRKYVYETVTINQDASTEPTDAANKANANETSTIWTELPLPSFFDSLPPHSQQLLRRARTCDPNPPLSVWDRKRNEWVRPEKAKVRGLGTDVLKSKHLMNVDLDQDQEDVEDDDGEEGSGDEEFGATVPAGKKRKVVAGPEERTIEIKKWVQVPLDKADKMPEPKYLADRRPGMGSVYTPAYLKSVTAFGAGSDGVGMSAGTFDIGEGGGLGIALGGPAAAPSGEATPRRNMPPKRKKKKLGGPGRRKAVPVEQVVVASGEVQEGQTVEKVVKEGEEVKKEGEEEGEEGSGDESEGEGSEEGEVNEDAVASVPVPVPAVSAVVPDVTVEEVQLAEVAETWAKVESVEEIPAPVVEEEVTEVKEIQDKEDVKMDLLGSVEAAVEGMEKGE